MELTNQQIARRLQDIPFEKIVELYKELQRDFRTIKPLSTRFNDIAGYYLYPEMLNTAGNKGVSFYDFYHNRDFYYQKNHTQNMVAYYRQKQPDMDEVKVLKGTFNLYYGSITNFSLPNVINFFQKYKPTCVLDPTSGFGNRLIGASVCGVKEYIGIDNNPNLAIPFRNLVCFLQQGDDPVAVQYFNRDCLTVDYSKLTYDMVFSSPPYYNTEIYGGKGKPYKTKTDWDTQFYRPLVKMTWSGLQPDGVFAINVPEQIYNRVLVGELGECVDKIPLVKRSRGNGYTEYIYVWRKP